MADEKSNEPEKLDLRSVDPVAARRKEVALLFPEARTEGGKIDFDQLKRALGETVEAGKERYGLVWPGKAECFKTIQAPSVATLRPAPEESVNFDTTENLIIEGDNLEVLKLLQKSYLGKVKLIYIDPPYNTGNDLIYPDNYAESLQTYLEYTGQVDAEGRKFGTNSEADGRFHSKWLNMMYSRLYLARNLLRDDGVIFVSINDKEMHNLRRVLDEIFGEENRIGVISWKNVTDNNPTLITSDNEFIVCYARSKYTQPKAWTSRFSSGKEILQAEYDKLKAQALAVGEIQEKLREFISDNEESVGFLSRYKFVDKDGVYTGSESVHNPRPGGYDFEVIHPTTKLPMRKPANGYRFPQATFQKMQEAGIILYGADEQRIVKIKKYLSEYEDSLRSVITLDGRLGSYELKRLFPDAGVIFTNPKPAELIETLISFAADSEGIVLDFFAGSGTTAQAVLELNQKGKTSRQFIVVQLPEPVEANSPAGKAGMNTISDIMKERTRRVIHNLSTSKGKPGDKQSSLFDVAAVPKPALDLGFRVFRLAQSNFRSWDSGAASDQETLETQLTLYVDHLRKGRTAQDFLYEILLKSGFPLTSAVDELTLGGQSVCSIAGGAPSAGFSTVSVSSLMRKTLGQRIDLILRVVKSKDARQVAVTP